MKKILISTLLGDIHTRGHKTQECFFIKALSIRNDITVLSIKNRYDTLLEKVRYITISENQGDTRISYHKACLCRAIGTIKLLKKEHYDILILFSYDVFWLSFLMLFLRNTSILVFEHGNIDEYMRNKKRRLVYRKICNNIHHLVFEDFIKEVMINNLCVLEKNITVVPHECNFIQSQSSKEKTIDCIALSNSNNEDWIKEIISHEENNEVIKNNGKHVIIKSKKYEYNNGNLVVFNTYLSDKDYNNLIRKTKSFFLP